MAEVQAAEKKSNLQKEATLHEIGFFALSFIAPVLLMAVIWGSIGITYGGRVTPLVYDLEKQYMPFYASLRYILSGENSLFFNWSFFMGGNFLGAYALDLASPLSWITVLWDLEHMPDAIYVLTLLKIGLCGLSFAVFTRFGFKNDAKRRCSFANVVFACCYALMSYNIVYSICLPWLEEVMLLPLILLGIEKLLQGKKGFVYFISIAGAFICNYYISYMVGIFAAAYILCRVGAEITKENKRKMFQALFRFGFNTLLALGVSMPLILPALRNLLDNMWGNFEVLNPGAYQFHILQLLQKFMPGHYDSLENWGLPSIYCGSVMVLLAAAYFFQKKYALREKISYLILLLVPFSGFVIKEIDYAWHGFKYPTGVPYRYAFVFSAAVLILAWKAYVQIPADGKLTKPIVAIAGGYLCFELFFNGAAIVSGIHEEQNYTVRSRYNQTMAYALPLVGEIRKDNSFFRAESELGRMGGNENMLFGLRGLSCFNSASNASIQSVLHHMGTPILYASSSGEGLGPVGDSLLGLKYRMNGRSYMDGYVVKSVCSVGEEDAQLYLHENPNALSLGYMADEESMSKGCVITEDVFENQNTILETLGVENSEVFKKIDAEVTENCEKVVFTVPSENPVYYYLQAEVDNWGLDEESGEWSKNDIQAVMRIIGEENEAEGNAAIRSIRYLGNFMKGETLTLEIRGSSLRFPSVYIYELDKEKYEAAMGELKEGEMNVASSDGGHITGRVTAKQGQMLFLTLPADTGYTVKVDGEESGYMLEIGAFMGVPVTEGEHQIEITYIPPGFKEGMMIGLASLIAAAIYFSIDITKKRFSVNHCE